MYKRFIYFTILFIVLSLIEPTMAELIAYYPMNEGSGNRIADVSGNGHHGIAQNGNATWVEGPPGFGNALWWNGNEPAAGYINCGIFNPSEGTNKLTVACWIKFAGSTGKFQGIVAKRQFWDTNTMMWYLEVTNNNPNRLNFTTCAEAARIYGSNSVPVDKWIHVAVTYDGALSIMYVNGQEIGRNNNIIPSKSGENTPVIIACSDMNGVFPFHGAIDEVRLYNSILSKEEITSLMNLKEGAPSNPKPANGAKNIKINEMLSWTPGKFANTHNVFLGTNPDNVKKATTTHPLDTKICVFLPYDSNSVKMSGLEYNTTYYWKVEEVNFPGDPKPVSGDIWSFTTIKP